MTVSIFGSLNVLFPISILFSFFRLVYNRKRIHSFESCV
jgi:hypothetical protein